ncbi:hypothetical protein ACFIJ5_16660 [Haloimpatiens sp. FM7330]|uniref:hypothetical protein n=1 Tax=Haloimpatiens sp. FM7330 TaxID=3298610 RepID=UPI00363761E9
MVFRYIIYFVFVILITMVLVYIGSIKERNLPIELTNKLYVKCSGKIISYLKKNESATMGDIQNVIRGISTSLFWSKKRVQVQNPVQFSEVIVEKMYQEGKIFIQMKKNKKIFILANK